MPDREKVIQGLEHCRLMCEGVPHNPCQGCLYQGKYDCADTLKTDALAMLKEQPEIVRCKDCVYHENEKARSNQTAWLPCMEIQTKNNWYCADGERKKKCVL